MIYTITFNPSLDYVVEIEKFALNKTNRTIAEQLFIGGKGLNVSMVLNNLGIENTALVFLAGFVGEEIKEQLKSNHIVSDFIFLSSGCSRINVKMKNLDGTEINGVGPDIGEKEIALLFQKLNQLKEEDILVLSGSIPKGVDNMIYQKIMKYIQNKDILVVVDGTKKLLLNTLECKPFLIKPNIDELEELFNIKIKNNREIAEYAKKLQDMGARNILVSKGKDGALLLNELGQVYELNAPLGEVVNSVGAGDSMVAGFLLGWLEKKDYFHALKMAIATGSASAFVEHFATKEEVQLCYEKMK